MPQPEQCAQFPEQVALSGQPMHFIPFFFSLRMYQRAERMIPATMASTIKSVSFMGNHLALSAYSAARLLSVFRIRLVMTTPMTATTARPRTAATMFKEAGAVIRVPTV